MVKSLQVLFRSRKFLIMLLDMILSAILYFVAKYASPSIVEDVKYMIVALQPVIAIVIAAIAYEDAANIRKANYHLEHLIDTLKEEDL